MAFRDWCKKENPDAKAAEAGVDRCLVGAPHPSKSVWFRRLSGGEVASPPPPSSSPYLGQLPDPNTRSDRVLNFEAMRAGPLCGVMRTRSHSRSPAAAADTLVALSAGVLVQRSHLVGTAAQAGASTSAEQAAAERAAAEKPAAEKPAADKPAAENEQLREREIPASQLTEPKLAPQSASFDTVWQSEGLLCRVFDERPVVVKRGRTNAEVLHEVALLGQLKHDHVIGICSS
jgi:hypothetical protein